MQNNFNYALDDISNVKATLYMGLKKQTVKELKDICKNAGIYIKTDMNKINIINVLINIIINKL
jgi:hypothetical protein